MKNAQRLWSLLRSAAVPALGVAVIAFFACYALVGPNGVLAWGRYAHQLQQREARLAAVERTRDALSNRVALLDPHHVNPDLADELLRSKLGLIGKDEVVVPLH